MPAENPATLTRDCEVIEIPDGTPARLRAGAKVRILNSLGGSFSVTATDTGRMFRIEAKDADALGKAPAATGTPVSGPFNEKMVWDQLKTIFDPEIPVNVVDLGLIYSCTISNSARGGREIDVKMSITAPGCGMADVLKRDVEKKLSTLPEVNAVRVEVVLDPPWNPGRMSDAAKLQLGLDADYGSSNSGFPVLK